MKKNVFFILLILISAIGFVSNYNSINAYETITTGKLGFFEYYIKNDEVIITEYTGAEFTVNIPTKIKGKKVTEIGMNAFEGNKYINEVKLPPSVVTIDDWAFTDCKNLVKVSGMKNVQSIGMDAFQNTNIETIDLTGVKYISLGAFDECRSLKSITIPTGVSRLDSFCSGCEALESVYIPSSVKELVGFDDCINLRKVEIHCENISGSFCNCPNLSEVIIGKEVRGSFMSSFQYCTSLKNITIPGNVREISMDAFLGCTSLERLNLNRGLISIDGFSDTPMLRTVDIPNTCTRVGNDILSHRDHVTIPVSVTNIYDVRFIRGEGGMYHLYSGSYASEKIKGNLYYMDEDEYEVDLLAPIESTNFDITEEDTIYIQKDESVYKQLAYNLAPQNTTDAIVWTSSDSSIVKVNAVGEIRGVKKGSATIIARTTSGIEDRINVVVTNVPSKISFAKRKVTVEIGKTIMQKAVVSDKDGIRDDVKPVYESSNPKIANVNKNGKVIAKKSGIVTITAKTANLKATYVVVVVKKN